MHKHLKVAVAGALVLSLAGLGGVSSVWTEQASTEVQNLETGSGALSLSDGDLRTTAESSATDLVPGDIVTRTVTVKSDTTYALSKVALNITKTGDAELLDGTPNAVAALQMEITNAANDVLYSGAAKDAAVADIGGNVLNGGGGETALTVKITFPASSDNASKAKSAHFTYVFTGTQRDGVATP